MHRKLWNTTLEKVKRETAALTTESEKRTYLDDFCMYELKAGEVENFYKAGCRMPHLIKMEEYYLNCFACLYAFSKEHVGAETNAEAHGAYCKSCPLKWDTTETEYSCCNGEYGYFDNHEYNSVEELVRMIEQIATLPGNKEE